MPGLFEGKKLGRGLAACHLVVPLMQESRPVLTLARTLLKFGLLHVAVCAARAKYFSVRQYPTQKNKIPNILRYKQALSLVCQHHPPFENRRKNNNA